MLSQESDGILLQRYVQDHDEPAFQELVDRYTPLVQSVCRGVIGDSRNTDVAVHDTFEVLMQRSASLKRDEPLGGWLRVAALGCARQQRRSSLRRQGRETPSQKTDAGEAAQVVAEERELITSSLQVLPNDQRRALIMRYIEHQPEEAVARILSCPQRMLQKRIMAGLVRLRDRFRSKGRLAEMDALVLLLQSLAGAPHPEPLTVPVPSHAGARFKRWLSSHRAAIVCILAVAALGIMCWLVLHHAKTMSAAAPH